MDAPDPLFAAALDGLVAPVAVVEPRGRVWFANSAWSGNAVHPWAGRFAPQGGNLVAVLSSASRGLASEAASLAAAIDTDDPAPNTTVAREYALGDARAPTYWRTTARHLPGGRWLVIHEDITSPRNTEAALKRSQARLRTILTGAPLVLFSLDTRGVFTLVEGMGAGVGGFVGPDQVGTSVFATYAHMPALLDAVRDALGGSIAVSTIHVGRLAFEIRCSPLYDVHGSIDGVVGIATDVSERVRLQRLKDEFISIVSHELRTPLTSIRGSLGLLEGGVAGPLAAKPLELLRIARLNTDRLIRLIGDMLDLDKMEAGLLELQVDDIDLGDVIDIAMREMAGLAAHAGVRIAKAENIARNCVVSADHDRMVQVLVNLLSNAIKFSPHEGEVVVSLLPIGGHARVEVRDRGPGIAPDDIGRLFQKFSQIDSSDTRARGGSGLGLVISKRIVEALAGRIGVESRVGSGSTFWIELPLPHKPKARIAMTPSATRDGTVAVPAFPGAIPPTLTLERIEALSANLQAAVGGDTHALGDAHATAMILAASMTSDVDAQGDLLSLAREIDTALATDGERRTEALRRALALGTLAIARLRHAAAEQP